MTIHLGIDIGPVTTCLAGGAEQGTIAAIPLSPTRVTMPTTVGVDDAGAVEVGTAATTLAIDHPDRVATGFVDQIDDPGPFVLGGEAYSPTWALAAIIEATVGAGGRLSGPPGRVALSHPTWWDQRHVDRLTEAARAAGLQTDAVELVSAPLAAVRSLEHTAPLPVGSNALIYDLGGRSFDATIVARTESGYQILGRPERLSHLGGLDFDEAVHRFAVEQLNGPLRRLDPADPSAARSLAQLRRDCVAAKEQLSIDDEAEIVVRHENGSGATRITRRHLDGLVRPGLMETIGAVRRLLGSAGVDAAALDRVVLVGGSSRIPLVSELLSAELGRTVNTSVDPDQAVAIGAAMVAVAAAGADAGTPARPSTSSLPAVPPPTAITSSLPAVPPPSSATTTARGSEPTINPDAIPTDPPVRVGNDLPGTPYAEPPTVAAPTTGTDPAWPPPAAPTPADTPPASPGLPAAPPTMVSPSTPATVPHGGAPHTAVSHDAVELARANAVDRPPPTPEIETIEPDAESEQRRGRPPTAYAALAVAAVAAIAAVVAVAAIVRTGDQPQEAAGPAESTSPPPETAPPTAPWPEVVTVAVAPTSGIDPARWILPEIVDAELGVAVEVVVSDDPAASLATGEATLALIEPNAYAIAAAGDVVPLASMLTGPDDPGYRRAYGVTAIANAERPLDGYLTETVCLPDRQSDTAYQVPAAALFELGLDVTDPSSPPPNVRVAGGHDAAIDFAARGLCAVSFVDADEAAALLRSGRVAGLADVTGEIDEVNPGAAEVKVVWVGPKIVGATLVGSSTLPDDLRQDLADVVTSKVNQGWATSNGACTAPGVACDAAGTGGWGFGPAVDADFDGHRLLCRVPAVAACET